MALLLDHGANVRHSSALQCAAGAIPDPEPTPEDPEPEDVPAECRPETDDEMGRVLVMQLLLENGAEINAVERMHAGDELVAELTRRRGRRKLVLGTALHRAGRAGAVTRFKWLLGRGADPMAVDTAGKSVVDVVKLMSNRPRCSAALAEVNYGGQAAAS